MNQFEKLYRKAKKKIYFQNIDFKATGKIKLIKYGFKITDDDIAKLYFFEFPNWNSCQNMLDFMYYDRIGLLTADFMKPGFYVNIFDKKYSDLKKFIIWLLEQKGTQIIFI